jgi:transposase
MTVLRRVRAVPPPQFVTPRVLGVDDWARRKGQAYGTILVDLERHRVIDVLGDRSAGTFARWLGQHPGVEVISRDRGGPYADGARHGAPHAVQVADRWHLMRNLGTTLERILTQRQRYLIEGNAAVPDGEETMPSPSARPHLTASRLAQEERQAYRRARYAEVVAQHQAGVSIRAICRSTGISRGTIRRYLRAGSYPEIAPRPRRPSLLDPYTTYLEDRIGQGCTNSAALFREIQKLGYGGGRSILKERVATLRSIATDSGPVPAATSTSPRQTAWLIVRRPDQRTLEQQVYLDAVRTAHHDLDLVIELAEDFATLVRERRGHALQQWMGDVERCGVAELQTFATGLQRDGQAVIAGLTLPWSNGQTEGQVNRLKVLKRQMYGRANLDLLRLRVLHRA